MHSQQIYVDWIAPGQTRRKAPIAADTVPRKRSYEDDDATHLRDQDELWNGALRLLAVPGIIFVAVLVGGIALSDRSGDNVEVYIYQQNVCYVKEAVVNGSSSTRIVLEGVRNSQRLAS